MNFKRIFLLVMDSCGIGAEKDSEKFGDVGVNTWVHTSEKCNGLNIPTLNSLGVNDIAKVVGTNKVDHPNSYVQILHEASNGKDTLTGHWEMMGIRTDSPLVTFTDTGFPKELIDELEKRFNRKLIGNYSESGTVILTKLGEQSIKEKSMIIYTSADSVLQLAANVDVIPLEELYRCCEIAREVTLKKEWRVGRVIARPFVGTNKDNFVRTPDRRDYALSPSGLTCLDNLKENGYSTLAIGKIGDIFNGCGISYSEHTKSNHDGMLKTIDIAKNNDFTGLCFVNLVEFDSLYGHRRDPIGYGKAIEEFDVDLKELMNNINDDDLILITADHGNDPTYKGSDHTREQVPLISYSKKFTKGTKLADRYSFADIGATICSNFGIKLKENQIGLSIDELLK